MLLVDILNISEYTVNGNGLGCIAPSCFAVEMVADKTSYGDSKVFFPRIQLDGISSTCEAAKALRKQFGKLDEGPQLSVLIGNHRTPLEDVKLVSNCREIERVKIAKLRYHLRVCEC